MQFCREISTAEITTVLFDEFQYRVETLLAALFETFGF